MHNHWLFAGGILSAIAALLHLGCIAFGPSWYMALGAGPRMARLAERGSWEPAIVTLGIAVVLLIWAAYAFSGAGILPPLPLLRLGLIAISAVYLARAAALPWMLMHAVVPGRGPRFLFVSSGVVLVLGVIHAVGIWADWTRLDNAA